MSKKELTLEELQAKKSKTQRGWVRFCAIVLAISLTVGIYFIGSKGGPRKQKFSPNVVQVNSGTIIQKEDAPSDTDAPAEEPAPAPETEEEGGGFLDTILGLLGGFDPSSIMDMLGPIMDKLGGIADGGAIADKIDGVANDIIAGIEKLEGQIKPIASPTRPVEEVPFETVTDDAHLRNSVVSYYNKFTAKVVDKQAGYSMQRTNTYAEGGNTYIGSKTEKANEIIGKVTGGKYVLDDIILAFTNGTKDETSLSIMICQGQSVDSAIDAYSKFNSGNYENFRLAQLKKTALKADDINNVQIDLSSGTVTFDVKTVKNPDRKTNAGLAAFTQDYVVREEAAKKLKDATSIKGSEFGILKLMDLDLAYENVTVTMTFDSSSFTGSLLDPELVPQSIQLQYNGRSKFVVRNNAIKVTGKATTTTTTVYKDFLFA